MIKIRQLYKEFRVASGQTLRAVDHIDLDIGGGMFFTLLGPSGCGKTTTLRCIAGLERPGEGEIEIFGHVVSSTARNVFVPPYQRDIGMVFQSYAIWPHMSVFDNVIFPLQCGGRKLKKEEVRERARRALSLVGLDGLENRPSVKLSGGQQQRLALARALIAENKILLLDEPLSNLDAKLRDEMRVELRRLHRSLGLTTVYVTHDQIEALVLSDLIAIMQHGRIVQIGTPTDIYRNPATSFIADFMGKSNRISGTITARLDANLYEVMTKHGPLGCVLTQEASEGRPVEVFLRPKDMVCTGQPTLDGVPWKGQLEHSLFHGDGYECFVRVEDSVFRAWMATVEEVPREGQDVWLRFEPRRCIAIPDLGEGFVGVGKEATR